MITFIKGNIFESKANCLVNTVNCVGVMGGGLALQFKNRFPQMYNIYKQACNRGIVKVGKIHLVRMLSGICIANFPTKDHYIDPSELVWIIDGLKDLKKVLIENYIPSVAIPPLGCGLGGLDWKIVKPLIVKEFEDFKGDVYIYLPLEE